MRVLHIIESLEFGGAEKVTVDLANAMANNHQIAICCVKRTGDLVAQLDPAIKVYCLDKAEGNDLTLPLRIRKTIHLHQAEIVHLHDWGTFLETGIAALLCPRVRVLQTIHGPYTPYSKGLVAWIKKSVRHVLELFLVRRYFSLIAVANSIKTDMLKRRLPATKLVTIYNGITTEEPLPSTDTPTPFGNPRLISVARLAPVKNQSMLLAAFKKVLAAYPNASLWIVGDGPSSKQLRAEALQLEIADRLCFTGFRADASSLLPHADLFLLSSEYEGISISLLEAMRAGVPVVATSVGGIPETVISGVTGKLVSPDDSAAFSTAIIELCASTTERTKMGNNSKQRQREFFSIDAMANQYLNLYESH